MRRSAPRPVGLALDELRARLAPATPLAAIQRAWPEVAGEVIAREARPVAERDGAVTIACRSAVWAQELDLMGPDLVERLNGALERPLVRSLRCRATGGGISG
jgi:predicted nucleic acid-binding Zn ribbon protein